jgi:hypothetical protein
MRRGLPLLCRFFGHRHDEAIHANFPTAPPHLAPHPCPDAGPAAHGRRQSELQRERSRILPDNGIVMAAHAQYQFESVAVSILMFPILAAMRQAVKLIYRNVMSVAVGNCGCPAILQMRRYLRTNKIKKGGTHDSGWASFPICRRSALSHVFRDCIGLLC